MLLHVSDFLCGSPNLALVDPLGESERVEGLPEVLFSRVEVDEHQCLGVATQGVHQEVGQLRIPIRYVTLSVLQNKKEHKNLNKIVTFITLHNR